MENVELPDVKLRKKLPSSFQIGEYCNLKVSIANILMNGKVIKVHFAPGKVTYDLEFVVTTDYETDKCYTTRIHNVDSALCEPTIIAHNDSVIPKWLLNRTIQKFPKIKSVEDMYALTDQELLSVPMFGKMRLERFRGRQ